MNHRTVSPEARRAHSALWAAFVVMGVGAMSWTPRIPEITEALALSATGLGVVLFLYSTGALVGAHLLGGDRVGVPRRDARGLGAARVYGATPPDAGSGASADRIDSSSSSLSTPRRVVTPPAASTNAHAGWYGTP